MGNLMSIIEEKKVLDKNLMYRINRYILWTTYVKPILVSYKESELSYDKLQELIIFLQNTKFKDNDEYKVSYYAILKEYKRIKFSNSEYALDIRLSYKEKETEIEYIVYCSNTTYNYTIPRDNLRKVKGCIYNQLHDNINYIVNDFLFKVCKEFIFS